MMKTIITLLVWILAVSFSLSGQSDLYNYRFNNLVTDTTFLNSSNVNPQISNNYKIDRKIELFGDKKMDHALDLPNKHITQDHMTSKNNPGSPFEEKFPGSSRYFARMSFPNSVLNEKAFIIIPDTTVKRYLIIINPLHFKTIR